MRGTIERVAQNKLQGLNFKRQIFNVVGHYLNFLSKEYHGAFSKKVELWFDYCKEEFLVNCIWA